MKKYIIIKEGLGVKEIVSEISDKENAVNLAEFLNEISEEEGSAMQYFVFEQIQD